MSTPSAFDHAAEYTLAGADAYPYEYADAEHAHVRVHVWLSICMHSFGPRRCLYCARSHLHMRVEDARSASCIMHECTHAGETRPCARAHAYALAITLTLALERAPVSMCALVRMLYVGVIVR
jgi:hypothetical protein